MNDTAGFYKFESDLLLHGKMVHGPGFDLIQDFKDTYQYPVEGWYWFESEDQAREFFELPLPTAPDSV